MKKAATVLLVILIIFHCVTVHAETRNMGDHAETRALKGFEDFNDQQFQALWDADTESLFSILENIKSLSVVADNAHVPAKGKALKIEPWGTSTFTLDNAGDVTGMLDVQNFYGFDGIGFWMDTTGSLNTYGKFDFTLGFERDGISYKMTVSDQGFDAGLQKYYEMDFSEFTQDDDFCPDKINFIRIRFHSLGGRNNIYYLSDFYLYRNGMPLLDKLQLAREQTELYFQSLDKENYTRESLEDAAARLVALCEQTEEPGLITGSQYWINQLTDDFLKLPNLLQPVDQLDKLKAFVEMCRQIDTSSYTIASRNLFLSALQQAENAVEENQSDDAVLKELYDNLYNAWIALESEQLYTAGLEILISQCSELSSEDYSHDSWQELQRCLKNATNLLKNPAAKQTDINLAELELSAAMENLIPMTALDYTAIEAAIARASALKAADYTEDSFSAMLSMKQAAEKEIISITRTQSSLNLCADNLNQAIDALVPVYINREGLNSAIARVMNLQAGNYTADSYNALIEKANAGYAVLYDPGATQKEINTSADQISKYINRLKRRGTIDRAELGGLISQAEKLSGSEYESAGFGAFGKALHTAKEVYENGESDEKQVHAAGTSLLTAWGKLKSYIYSPYITSFDYKNMKAFEGTNLEKSVLKVSSDVPFDGTKGLHILFDVGDEDTLTIQPNGVNLDNYPELAGYEGVEYYANTEETEGIYALVLQLMVEDENGKSVYTIETEADSAQGYTRYNFSLNNAQVSGSNAHDLYDYNRIGVGLIASCGELEVTALRAYRHSFSELPGASNASQGQDKKGGLLSFIANPKTSDFGLGAVIVLLALSVYYIFWYRKKKISKPSPKKNSNSN